MLILWQVQLAYSCRNDCDGHSAVNVVIEFGSPARKKIKSSIFHGDLDSINQGSKYLDFLSRKRGSVKQDSHTACRFQMSFVPMDAITQSISEGLTIPRSLLNVFVVLHWQGSSGSPWSPKMSVKVPRICLLLSPSIHSRRNYNCN